MEIRPTIKNHSHGYVKPDGNPMTGGEWWSITALYKKFIPIDSLTDDEAVAALDYVLSHHLDFRGLIPMGLALEAPEGMYENE